MFITQNKSLAFVIQGEGWAKKAAIIEVWNLCYLIYVCHDN